MSRAHEILEVLPDGPKAKRNVSRLEFAKAALEDLSQRTTNECIAADEKTHQVVARMNAPPSKGKIKRIFQIAYDEEAGLRRTALLRSCGYGVISVLGNEAAKVLLSYIRPYDLFIVGDAAPEKYRREMVAWLKTKYPKVEILALNPPYHQLPDADYNALQGDSEGLLLFITERLTKSAAVR